MAVIIAFSGSSNSGKTTLINRIAARIPGCHILGENIRDYLVDTSIDAVRANAWSYFELQRNVIRDKINRENAVKHHDSVILVDRSLADSLWYLTHYTNTTGFSDDQLKEYTNFVQEVIAAAREFCRYDHIFFARPIQLIEKSQFRPTRLNITQQMESKMIETLTFGLFGATTRITCVDVMSETDLVISACLQASKEIA